MGRKQPSVAKITRPTLPAVLPRERLFRLLDGQPHGQVTWISGPAGAGKTTLVTSWLDVRAIPCIWYQIDAGDGDIASFFYYLGLAAKKAAPRVKSPLPLLTPEYLLDVPTFAQRFLEDLCGRLTPRALSGADGFVIVFDNYQNLPLESPFHDILVAALSRVPDGFRVLIISRMEHPPAFTGMVANDRMRTIDWEEIRFAPDESDGLVRLHLPERQGGGDVVWMHERSRGWAAGLVLLAKAAKANAIDPAAMSGLAPEKVFDYFASELFDKRTDEATKEFLLKTAVLPRMTPPIAERLTGNAEAGRILAELNRRNYFTERRLSLEQSYQYHPLFREFLNDRAAKTFSRDDLVRLKRQAAEVLAQADHVEDSAQLYIEAEEWDGLVQLILKNAPAVTAQGRSSTLEKWILAVPATTTDRVPWLLFWMGVCRIPFSISESRHHFDRAFHQFDSAGDRLGALFAWCGIVDSYIYEFGDFTKMGKWAAWFKRSIGKSMRFPSPEVEYRAVTRMMVALMFSVTRSREIKPWAERAKVLADACQDKNVPIQASVFTGLFYSWIGDLETLGGIVQDQKRWCQSREITPFSMVHTKYVEAMHQWLSANADFGLHAASEGLALSSAHGIHFADLHLTVLKLFSALNSGDRAQADEVFGHMQSQTDGSQKMYSINYQYQYVPPWYSLFKGAFTDAYRQSLMSLRLIRESGSSAFHRGFSNITAAQALLCMGKFAKSQPHIAEVRRMAEDLKSPLMEFSALLLESQRHLLSSGLPGKGKAGKRAPERRGLDTLRSALALGKARGYLNAFMWYAPVMASLCVTALEHGIETDYVKDLIRKRNLVPAGPDMHFEEWPWPVKVYTLGRFRIDVEGKPLEFPGKAQKKPLEMLKALIAFGGKDVGQEQISEVLWPDAEGDHAHKSFEMTLQRLRRMLGRDEAVRLQGGQVSLDDRLCWTDVATFERLLGNADRQRGGDGTQRRTKTARMLREVPGPVEKAIGLYQGDFLPDDGRQLWCVAMRERLRSRFLRLIVRTGESLEQARQWQKAIELYERGIETDALAEELYQRLMGCHERLGQEAQAVMVYQRCKAALLRDLGVAPSSKTEALYKHVLRARQ